MRRGRCGAGVSNVTEVFCTSGLSTGERIGYGKGDMVIANGNVCTLLNYAFADYHKARNEVSALDALL